MQIGFVILGIAAVFLLIIGAFCSRKFMEKRRREKPAAKTETAQKKPNVAAKRATMNIAGLSADGPSMPGSRPTVRAETRVPVSNEPQTTINLAMLQSRPQETPVSQPVVQPVVQPETTQPMMPAGQMPFMYPPYMMGMAPGTSTPQMGTPQMSTPQMAHMPNGYPMGFGAQMWPPFMHMGQMMPNYPPNSTVSMPVSPTQPAPATQSSGNRRNRNRNQSIIQPSGNYRRESFMPPELSDTHRPRQCSQENDDDLPPPSYSVVCPSTSRRQ
ncbi:hypothetical protein IW139_002025 [Coemansia sp. RSA 353]|nr:hypothetical protein GGH18_002749 [Coemansia sp. RSA 530]KAJ2289994.1 hypothetical protein IW141_003535 [Coemansia sp. RSA 355]KAJ2298904.1 hypothetical protein IW139_002025 [Coemansia sp. RSA 353]KAJ2431077.1 hypothetical protein IWW41_003032 [Coemansia sp. RSA 2522]